jgi:hypothetical protein
MGATVSTLVNSGTDNVLVTYCAMFLGGAAMYIALAGARVTPTELSIGSVGLAIGSMFPLVNGLRVFRETWGFDDIHVVLNAYMDLQNMMPYEDATYGNRGNTAALIVLIAPILVWTALDTARGTMVRVVAAVALMPIALNLLILEVRAAFITLAFSVALIFAFKLGVKWYALFVAGCIGVLGSMVKFAPDVAETMAERMQTVITLDVDLDPSVLDRSDAIREGWRIGQQHSGIGIGPGAGLAAHSQTSSHQLFVQQFMENGVLGLLGCVISTIAVFGALAATVWRGKDRVEHPMRFPLLIGPASFLLYGVFANVTFSSGYLNTWTVVAMSMLALAPLSSPGSVVAPHGPRPGRR